MRKDAESGFHFSWQNLITTVGLIVIMVGGFWTLAFVPIQNTINDLKGQLADIRAAELRHYAADESKFLTQKEHNEFKQNVHEADARQTQAIMENLRKIDKLRADAVTRSDIQQPLTTTRVEFLSEIKRIDQELADNMKRKEFEAWRSEREKTISSIQDRQNRFSEALDAMYSKLMQQIPSYAPRQP